jgi:hypothetical protein
VALVTTDVSEERIASIIKVKRIRDLQLLVIANVPSSLIIFSLADRGYTFFGNVGSYNSHMASLP